MGLEIFHCGFTLYDANFIDRSKNLTFLFRDLKSQTYEIYEIFGNHYDIVFKHLPWNLRLYHGSMNDLNLPENSDICKGIVYSNDKLFGIINNKMYKTNVNPFTDELNWQDLDEISVDDYDLDSSGGFVFKGKIYFFFGWHIYELNEPENDSPNLKVNFKNSFIDQMFDRL